MNENHNELRKMYCASCGRFLGYQAIESGGVALKCKCGEWTFVKAEGSLISIKPEELDKHKVN